MKRKGKKRKNHITDVFAFDRSLKIPHNIQILHNIVSKAQKLKGNNLALFLEKVFNHRLCPEKMHCRYKTKETFLDNYRYYFYSVHEELLWFKYLFSTNNELLKRFLNSKDRIDLLILTKDGQIALNEIEKIENDICLSLWGFEQRIHIMKELLNQDTSAFISKLKQDTNNKLSDFYCLRTLVKTMHF